MKQTEPTPEKEKKEKKPPDSATFGKKKPAAKQPAVKGGLGDPDQPH